MAGSNRSTAILLRELASLRERHCAEALSRAREQARQVVRPAFGQARLRVRNALTEERELIAKRLQAAEARLRLVREQRSQRQQKRLLQLAFSVLSQRLVKRWRDPVQARQWALELLGDAQRQLPTGRWQISHPTDWPPAEREYLRRELLARGLQAPDFQPDEGVTAGLRIGCGGAVLDGSVAGLTSDRRSIEARLLALLNEPRAESRRESDR